MEFLIEEWPTTRRTGALVTVMFIEIWKVCELFKPEHILPYHGYLSTPNSTLLHYFVHCVELLLITIYVLFRWAQYDFRRDEAWIVVVNYWWVGSKRLRKRSIGRVGNKLIRELENLQISDKSQLVTDYHSALDVHIWTSYLISQLTCCLLVSDLWPLTSDL